MNATSIISLSEQAAAVERAAINQRGFVNRLSELVECRKRSADELLQQQSWTPALEAAAVTMRLLADRKAT